MQREPLVVSKRVSDCIFTSGSTMRTASKIERQSSVLCLRLGATATTRDGEPSGVEGKQISCAQRIAQVFDFPLCRLALITIRFASLARRRDCQSSGSPQT